MNDASRIVIGRSMAAIAVLGAVVGVVWLVFLDFRDALWGDWVIHNAIIAVGSGVMTWTVVRNQPRNAEIWVFAWAGLLTGMLCLTYATAAQMMTNSGVDTLLDLVPSEVPLPVALVMMNANWLWMGIFLPFTLGLQLFPDGKPSSPRWRWFTVATIVVLVVTALGLFWEARPSGVIALSETQDMNGGFRSITSSVVTVGYPLLFFMVLVSVGVLVARFRRSSGFERQQFRWVVWGAAVAGVAIFAALLIDELGQRLDISLVVGALAMATLLASFGVAIGKYRIYDIDVVISRTLVYGTLAAFIGTVYIGIAVVPWLILGSEAGSNPWLGIVATAIVAVAFQPLRRRLQKVANRLVYGKRATPYEVLSSFSQGISAVDPDVLAEVAKSLAEGTTAEWASIWVGSGSESHEIARWPGSTDHTRDVSSVSAPVVHGGEELGKVVLAIPPGQPFPANDQRLVEQVASGLGLALRNLQLTEDLSTRVDQLRESRRRVVALQDQTRRLLERDLHDGAQQRLVALKIKIGLASTMAKRDEMDDVERILAEVRDETDLTIDSLRSLARGIYPPLLEAEGLGAALSAQLRRAPVPITVQAAGVGRYPQEIEATLYFCVLEAVQNAIKHARAQSVLVTVSELEDTLGFEVRDDGVGFDLGSVSDGQGLVNMADRLDAVEGNLVVETGPGRGTSVTGSAPVRQGVPA